MAYASMVALSLVALATLTSAYYVNQPSYGDQSQQQQVQSVQHYVSSDQSYHAQHPAYVNQPQTEGGRQAYVASGLGLGAAGGAGDHAIYININGPSMKAASPHPSPCDDPVLSPYLLNCHQQATTSTSAPYGGAYG